MALALLCVAAAAKPTTAPDVVVLSELKDRYEAVPFDHKSHASMAQMWDGCVTCHHRKPDPTTQPVAITSATTQADSAAVPACKSCHQVSAEKADLHRPNLKGAYHRQCLNCHREWANENACNICHKPLGNTKVAQATTAPSVDDIVGRMHPPIPEPEVKIYEARFTPAVGANAIFRHKEHTTAYGLKCASCHHRDNCSDCHNGITRTIAHKPIKPGRTWQDSHEPCMSCHQQDRCGHCHFDPKAKPPATFAHRSTGQVLDKDHDKLTCGQCHNRLKSKTELTCGDASCHAKHPTIAFPAQRPGPVIATQPATAPATRMVTATTLPTTRAVIKRIRR